MADKLVKKEVGADGLPLMRVSGYLISAVHTPFVWCLDNLLSQGWISDAEYVQLTEGMTAAMTAFRESIPAEVANRPYSGTAYQLAHEAKMEEAKAEAPAVVMYDQAEQEKQNVLTQWLTGLTEKLGRIVAKVSDKPVPEEKPIDEKADSSVRFFKDKAGDWWMLGIYSNRWKDLQGEILSEAAHLEYARWVNATGFEPAVTLAHQPRLSEKFWKNMFRRFGNDIPEFNKLIGEIYKDFGFARVKRIVPLNGFVLAVAKVDPSKKDVAEKLSKVSNLAMSHGCLAFKETVDFNLDKTPVNIVDKYRSFEVTVLSKGNAANAVTIPIFVEARTMTKSMSDADRDLLSKILPEEMVAQVDTVTSSLEKDLNERLAFKDDPKEESKKEAVAEEVKEPEVAAPAAAETPAEAPAEALPASAPAESSEVEAVVEAVIKSLNTDGLKSVLSDIQTQLVELKEKVAELDGLKVQVKQLSRSDDEKIAAQLAPPARPGIDWGAAPSRSTANLVEAGDQNLKEKETIAVGDASLDPSKGAGQLDPNNPIHAMLFSKLK